MIAQGMFGVLSEAWNAFKRSGKVRIWLDFFRFDSFFIISWDFMSDAIRHHQARFGKND